MIRSPSGHILTMDEDILRQTFSDSTATRARVVEDDMEDLISMPVDKALKSRRPSQLNLRTYLPSSGSTTALRSASGGGGAHSAGLLDDEFRWENGNHDDEIVETLQVERPPSRLPRRASDSSLRSSTSRQTESHPPPLPIGPIVPVAKSRSTSPTVALVSSQRGYVPGKGGSLPPRAQMRKGSLPESDVHEFGGIGPAKHKRKVQDTTMSGKSGVPSGKKKVPPEGTTTVRRTPSPTALSSSPPGIGLGKPPRFPSTSPTTSISKSSTSTSRPPNPSSTSDPSLKPRQRAQTQNWQTTTPSRSASTSAISALASASTASGIPTATGSRKPGTTAARGVTKRTNTNQTRQRSVSTSGAKWGKQDLRDDEGASNPPWLGNDVPKVFRDGTTGELGTTGRLDELVLPAVARRLEAERLLKMDQDSVLIGSWEKDGTPRGNLVAIRSRSAGTTSPHSSNSESPTPHSLKIGTENVDPTTNANDTPPTTDEEDCRAVPASQVEAAPSSGMATESDQIGINSLPPPRASSNVAGETVVEVTNEKVQKGKKEKEGGVEKDDSHGAGCCSCSIM